jgi:hypothetical protein
MKIKVMFEFVYLSPRRELSPLAADCYRLRTLEFHCFAT